MENLAMASSVFLGVFFRPDSLYSNKLNKHGVFIFSVKRKV